MIPCVVLASMPKNDTAALEALEDFEREYADFQPVVIRKQPHEIHLHPHNAQDGGNGGGGEPGGAPMKPAISKHKRTFWDFWEYPNKNPEKKPKVDTPERDIAFPPQMRFELCLHFQDISYAATFLSSHPAGERLAAAFTYVQIVAISTPAFVGTVKATNTTPAFDDGVRTKWVGTSS